MSESRFLLEREKNEAQKKVAERRTSEEAPYRLDNAESKSVVLLVLYVEICKYLAS